MAEREYVDEVVGGDGKRYYALRDEQGNLIADHVQFQKAYAPQQEATPMGAAAFSQLWAGLDLRLDSADAQALLAQKADQSALQALRAQMERKILRSSNPDLSADIFPPSLTPGHIGWNTWSYAKGTDIPHAPQKGTRWYEVITGGNRKQTNRGFQMAIEIYSRAIYIRFVHDNVWSSWATILAPSVNL